MARKAGTGHSVTITGDKALIRKLRSLPGKVRRNVVRSGLRAGAQIILEETRARAPVSPRPQDDPGALRDSLHVREVRSAGAGVYTYEVATGAGDFTGHQFYASFVEYGTSRMDAKPFMQPALQSAGPRARIVMSSVILAGIEREASK